MTTDFTPRVLTELGPVPDYARLREIPLNVEKCFQSPNADVACSLAAQYLSALVQSRIYLQGLRDPDPAQELHPTTFPRGQEFRLSEDLKPVDPLLVRQTGTGIPMVEQNPAWESAPRVLRVQYHCPPVTFWFKFEQKDGGLYRLMVGVRTRNCVAVAVRREFSR